MVDTTAPTTPGTPVVVPKGNTPTTALLTWTKSTDDVLVTAYSVYNGVSLLGTVSTATNDWLSAPGSMLSSQYWTSMAYGNGVFVAVSSNASTVAATSTDGITWTARTLPFTGFWSSVVFGNGVFVAMAASTTAAGTFSSQCARSTDGVTWTTPTLPSAAPWSSVTYGNGKFVAVAGSALLVTGFTSTAAAYSTDGTSWTASTLPGAAAGWTSVAYGATQYVAVSGNTVASTAGAYSADGITWTASTLPSATWTSVAYGNGAYVIVGGTSLYYSTNGVTAWVNKTVASGVKSVAFSASGVCVAAPSSTQNGYYSTDLTNWPTRYLPTSSNVTVNAICYGAGKFVAIAYNSAATYTFDVSASNTYTATVSQGTSYNFNVVAKDAANNASSASASTAFSTVPTASGAPVVGATTATTAALTWTRSTDDIAVTAYDVYNGASLLGTVSTPSQVWSSASSLPSAQYWSSVAYGNGVYVAVAGSSASSISTTVAAYSTDGVTWTAYTLPASAKWQSVTYGNGVFVAVAYGSTSAARSLDGITWTSGTMSSAANWNSVTYGNSVFVAISFGANSAAYSSDGITWTASALPGTMNWISVTYGNGMFLAVASGATNYATSTNGINWTQRTTLPSTYTWNVVSYGAGKFVALVNGSTNYAYSSDGLTWTASGMPASTSWQSLVYSDGLFLALGGAPLSSATSPDGVTWSTKTLSTGTPTQAMTAGPGKFITVSSGSSAVVNTFPSGPANTYTATIVEGSSYNFNVVAKDVGNHTTSSLTTAYSTVPTAPGAPVVGTRSGTSLPLTWAASTDNNYISSYDIYNGATLLGTVSGTPAATSYTATIARDNNYNFKVLAKDPANNSSSFSPVTAYSSFDVTPPGTPTNLAVTTATNNSVSLSWTASTDDWAVDHYDIRTNGIGTPVSTTSGSGAVTYTVTGLTNNTQYSFDVRAVDVDNNVSGWSTAVSTTTAPITGLAAVTKLAFGGVNDQFLAVKQASSPYLLAYSISGNTFTPLTLGTALPATPQGFSWSPDGQYLVVTFNSSPYVYMYYNDGTTLTRVNTSLAFTTYAQGIDWDPTSTFFTVSNNSSSVVVYKRTNSGSSATFAAVAQTAYLSLTNTGASVSWSPDGKIIAVGTLGTAPGVYLYSVDINGVLTPLYNGGVSYTGVVDLQWSPDSLFLAVVRSVSPYVMVLYRNLSNNNITVYTLATTPTSVVNSVSWSKDGNYLAVALTSSPYLTVHQKTYTTSSYVFTQLTSVPVPIYGTGNWVRYSKNLLAVGSSSAPYLSTMPSPTPDTTAPAAPTDLAVPSVVGQTVSLAWTASSSTDISSYLIRRGGTIVGNVPSWQTYYADLPSSPSTGYTYDVAAVDNANNTAWSSTTSTATSAASTIPTWSRQVINLPASSSAYSGSFQYLNGQFIHVGQNGLVARSSNGYDWTSTTSSVLAGAGSSYGALGYGGGKYVLLYGLASTIAPAYSSDGINWTLGSTIGSNPWTKVVYGNSTFIAIMSTSANALIGRSTDGVNWTIPNTFISSGTGASWSDITFANGKFVAIAGGNGTSSAAMYSTNGTSWTSTSMPFSSTWNSVAYASGRYVATNQQANTAYSTDGITWNSGTSFPNSIPVYYLDADASTGTLYGYGGNATYWSFTSTNGGVTWVPRPSHAAQSTGLHAAGGGSFVTLTSGAASPIVYTLGNFTGYNSNITSGTLFNEAWIDDGSIAAGVYGPPSLEILSRNGNTVRKVAAPDTLPVLAATPMVQPSALAVSPDGHYIAIGTQAISPYLVIYYWDGTSLSKLTNALPALAGQVLSLSWDSTSTLLAISQSGSAFGRIFQRSGSGTTATFTQPSTFASSAPSGISWDYMSGGATQYLSYGVAGSPYFFTYPITTATGAIGTVFSNPATLPTGAVTVTSWSPDTNYLAISSSATPYLLVYYRSGITLTKLADPATLPTGAPRTLSWSPDSATLVVTHSADTNSTSAYTLSGSGASAVLTLASSSNIMGWGSASLGTKYSPTSTVLASYGTTSPGLALVGASPPDTTPPTVPTISSVTHIGSSVTVSWDTNADVALYEVFRGGVSQGTTASTSFTQSVSDGTYSYTVRAKDAAGNWSAQSSSSGITVDTTPPTVPTISSVTNTGLSVTVSWNTNADVALYEVFRGGVSQGTTTSTSFNQSVPTEGTYSYTVRGQDAAGNWSAQSSSSGITVDTTPPGIPSISSVTNNGSSVTVSWSAVTGSPSLYTVYRGGTSQGTTASTSFTQTVSDGTYSYTVSASDAAGNESAQSSSSGITVDTTPPTIGSVAASRTAIGTTDRTVHITWSQGNDATQYQVRRNGSTIQSGSSAATSYDDTPLSDNTYTYGVRVADSYTNWSAWTDASVVLVDTVGPTTPTVTASVTATTKNVSISWNNNTDVSSYQAYRNESLIQDNIAGTSITDTVSTDGSYTYTVRGKDTSGNWSSYGSSSVTVDTTPPTVPNTPTLSVAAAPSRTVTASWNSNADVALYQVALDGSSQGTTTSTSYDILNVTDGTHTVSVRAEDTAGNWSSYSSTGTIIIDRTAPTAPNAPTSTRSLGSRTVVLSWNAISDAASYIVFRDGTQIATPGTNTYSDTVSTDGTYSYTIESVDAAGNTSTVSSALSATVDTTPPAPPTGLTATSGGFVSLSWTAVSDAATYGVYRNGSLTGSPSSTSFTDHPADGTYTYTVTALDVYSNESTASSGVSGTVDTTPPTVPTISVSAPVGSRVVTVSWGADSDVTAFEVKRNGTSLTSTATGTSYDDTVPSDNTYTYTVRAKDSYNNWSSFSSGAQITIDTLPPAVPSNIHGTPTRFSVLVSWDGDVDASQYEISRNGSVVGNSVFASFADTTPGYGVYFYKVRAKDAAGNWSAYSDEVEIDSVDTDPPATPSNLAVTVLGSKRVNLTWDADSDVSVWEVYRDGTLLTSRTTNSYVDNIPNFGVTTYKIRAKDLAGNYSGFTSNVTITFTANNPTLGRLPLNIMTVNQRPSDDASDDIRRMSRDDGDADGGLWPLP